MKNNKLIIVMIAIIIISTFISACAPKLTDDYNTKNGAQAQIGSEEHYNVSLINDAEVCMGRDYGPLYQRVPIMDFHELEHTTKSNMPNLNITLFGKEYNLFYFETQSTKISDYGMDLYLYSLNNTGYDVTVNSKTGKIVYFSNIIAGKDHEYVSPVNPSSSESEFIAYASSILSEYMDISTEGWNVEITTEKHAADEHWGIMMSDLIERKDGFVRYDVDPEIDVSYTINFYRYLNEKSEGVRLADTVFVKMTNFGEVVEFSGEVFDEKYIPYADIDLDVDKIADEFRKADMISTSEYGEPKMTLRAIAYNDELWIEATIRYKHMLPGDYLSETEAVYTIKVAEIIHD